MEDGWKVRMNIRTALWSFVNFCYLCQSEVSTEIEISGSTKTDPFNILSEQKRFYQDLYTSKNIRTDSTQTTESFLSNLDIPRLTEEQKLSCEGKITPEECAAVLENFQNNKSPGNDGIPV